jgi:hypothetical protein
MFWYIVSRKIWQPWCEDAAAWAKNVIYRQISEVQKISNPDNKDCTHFIYAKPRDNKYSFVCFRQLVFWPFEEPLRLGREKLLCENKRKRKSSLLRSSISGKLKKNKILRNIQSVRMNVHTKQSCVLWSTTEPIVNVQTLHNFIQLSK